MNECRSYNKKFHFSSRASIRASGHVIRKNAIFEAKVIFAQHQITLTLCARLFANYGEEEEEEEAMQISGRGTVLNIQ